MSNLSPTTYEKIVRFLILFGPGKLKIASEQDIRRAIRRMALNSGTSSADLLADLKAKGILSQKQIDEILKIDPSNL